MTARAAGDSVVLDGPAGFASIALSSQATYAKLWGTAAGTDGLKVLPVKSGGERVVWSVPLSANTSSNFDFAIERARFIAARKALSVGDVASFNRLATGLTHYPIYRYLVYERLRKQISDEPGPRQYAAVKQFEADYADSVLTRRLIKHLQQQLAGDGQWSLLLKVGAHKLSSSDLHCATIRARAELGQLTKFDKKTRNYWSSARPRPQMCARVLEELERRASPGIAALWNRIYDAIDRRRPGLATQLSGQLATTDRLRVNDWIAALDAPGELLESGTLSRDTYLHRRILLDLVWRWSKTELTDAVAYWQRIRARYAFASDERYHLDRMLGLRAAYRRLPEANRWLNNFDARKDDLELMEWRIRAALLAGDWKSVLARIEDLPEVEREQDHWQYWVARGNEEKGRVEDALKVYETLSELQSYYGFLAADRLGKPYALRDEPITPDPFVYASLQQNDQLIRAREYYRTAISWEGRREWGQVLDALTPDEKSAAARLALDWELHDRAIFTAGVAEHKRALSYRFPVLYEHKVNEAAARNRLEPALVLGVMRRESAFIEDIRSPAGAVGLMQLMPATAKDVSRALGRTRTGDLTDADTNIAYGTHYLRQMLDRFEDNPLLALASYNAGPHRVDKWILEMPDMEADRWVDTIPFSETRRYVRAVMAYSLIFDWRMSGKPTRLSNRMPGIEGVQRLADTGS